MTKNSDDYGSILDSPTEINSCGGVWCALFYLENFGNIVVINIFSYVSSGSCGTLNGKSINKFVSKGFYFYVDLNDESIIFLGIILVWIGFGTLFEINNGSERIVSPYLIGGTVR